MRSFPVINVTSGDTYGYDGFDVCYNDWKEGYNRPNTTSKPGFIREYYDYEFGGHYSTTRVTRGDGDYALMQNAWNAQWSHNRYRAYYPWTIGGQCGVCMIIIGDVVIIFVTVVWPICSAYPNSVYFISVRR